MKGTAVSQLAKEKSWLIKGDATGSAIAFHSLHYLILTYNFMFILKGYIRSNKHWLHLLLCIKKMLEAMPKNINSVSHLTCCCPPFPAKSLVKYSSFARCAALCYWVLFSVGAEKVPAVGYLQGHMPRKGECSLSSWLPGRLSSSTCIQSLSLHQHSPNEFLVGFFLLSRSEND